ncbi:MAG: DUF763 domain-containing protein [Candidatus Aenigmarchaeota archaeon]|nr:DUF763 domain-containing protein [Candidatus Aenigmarchaeota archaeon]
MKTGVAHLPLHEGRCPPWLFTRMKDLSSVISEILIYEYGQEEFLKRLSDPFFFQAFGCVLGFDFHSSGLTTTVTGALKEALNEADLGIKAAGGKGKTSRKAPEEIVQLGDALGVANAEKLVHASRMSAKVDSTAIQDSYQLYHHAFVFTEKGSWAVIQQGMNASTKYARRYHWLSSNVKAFIDEPHTAICCDKRERNVLDMTSVVSDEARKISVDIVQETGNIMRLISGGQQSLDAFTGTSVKTLVMDARHTFHLSKPTMAALAKAHELQPANYEELLALRGIGPKAIRALALISHLVYGAEPSWDDPVKFSYAVGGKDGVPYEINKRHYDNTIGLLRSAIENAKVGDKEKLHAMKSLSKFTQ